ncbi:porin [Aquirhabdus parva]|uniref:Porin n=2 Tax=Aquirhabdus parva TaxID=2283318 RepID=A0A345P877_9GAMM|nr:porin [Aquirhabdus parva]
MKFMNIPLAALTCTAVLGSSNASADLTVTSGNATLKAFGLIDTGLVAVTHTGDGHQIKTDTTDGILSASGLGLGGSYDFGSGFKAIVNLQASFSPSRLQIPTNHELFSRNAYAGLESPWGTFTLGKQWDFNDDWFFGTVFKGGYNTGAIFKFSEFDAISELYRNTVKYTSPEISGLQVGAMYGLNDYRKLEQAGSMYSLGVKYTSGPLMVGLTHNHEEDTGVDENYTGNRYLLTTLGSSYNWGWINGRLGLTYADISGPAKLQSIGAMSARKAYAVEVGVDYPFTSAFTGSANVIYRDNTTLSNQTLMYRLSGEYKISKPLSLTANLAYLHNQGGATESFVNTHADFVGGGYPNQNQMSTAVGVRYRF